MVSPEHAPSSALPRRTESSPLPREEGHDVVEVLANRPSAEPGLRQESIDLEGGTLRRPAREPIEDVLDREAMGKEPPRNSLEPVQVNESPEGSWGKVVQMPGWANRVELRSSNPRIQAVDVMDLDHQQSPGAEEVSTAVENRSRLRHVIESVENRDCVEPDPRVVVVECALMNPRSIFPLGDLGQGGRELSGASCVGGSSYLSWQDVSSC